ncbi:MBL fold metallo-hydrolase [Adlercreutzia sp. ZJ473]|uniref:MBL fold metallo-hydrolase n=1 Tax=Adlercreutzia sp. ZJ473 TaxID=2722822 RepID=UPI0015535C26|nr:MBL fold metallo-hydrolase [Adlercreutzia sp. ZJ473]
MRIRVLIDNNADEGLTCEWGLSLLVEHAGTTYLYDTGATGAFVANAKVLGVDLANVDACILSHAHFDHAGGLKSFADTNTDAPIYIASAAKENCYSRAKGDLEYIGIEPGLMSLLEDRIRPTSNLEQIGKGAYILGHDVSGYADAGAAQKMLIKVDDELVADDFTHEQSLILIDGDGIVVVNGCCHAGADVVVEEARRAFPGKPVKAVIGGLHLFDRNEEFVYSFAKKLADTGVSRVITGHCTGPYMPQLAETLGDKLSAFVAGATFEI